MKKLLLILILFLSSFAVVAQKSSDFATYQDWKIVYSNNCESKTTQCYDFYYAITRSVNKMYNPQDGRYYYYYYLIVQSNSTYSGGTWAYTKLSGVNFYLNGQPVYYEPYLLFREKKTVCIFWHPTDSHAQITFKWSNISVY